MITLNNRPYEWKEGMTIESLIIDNKFTYPKIYVKVNSKLVDKELYPLTKVSDGDKVEIIHLLAGG